MIKKGLLKRVAVFALATGLTLTTVGATTVFACDDVEATSTPAPTEVSDEATTTSTLDETTATPKVTDEAKATATPAPTNDNNSTTNPSVEPKKDENKDTKKDIKVELEYGVYENSIEGLHIKSDGLSQAEILKYEAAFKQAFANLVIDGSHGDSPFTVTINTNKFTFEGKEMYISGIDAFVNETPESELTPISMNPGKSKDGCPSSFTYTFDLTKIHAVSWSFNISIKSVDGTFEHTFTISELELKVIKFTAVDNTQTDKAKAEESLKDLANKKKAEDNAKNNEIIKKAAESKPAKDAKKDKSPKTSDDMSQGVMIAIIAGGVSLAAIVGLLIFKKKKSSVE